MRRWRTAESHSSHERWLVSYADFVTLLFAFFVVLFASSYRDAQAMKKLSAAIHVGFQQMGAFSGGKSDRGVAYPDLSPRGNPYTPANLAERTETDAPSATPEGSGIDILELRRQLENALGDEIKNHEVVMHITPEGFVISLRELGFFNSGQAVLLPGAAEKIMRIADVLSKRGLDLRVEGHSDDQPIHTDEFRSNWELSTARATQVVLLLVDRGNFDPHRISIAGYGQYRPVAGNDTAEGRRANRRVDLVVVSNLPARMPGK